MPILHIFILSAIQGITEFLPISSSGHLQMLPMLTNLEKQSVLIDISVHLGTLGGVIIFFFKDITKILIGFSSILNGKKSADGKILIMIIVATIPLIIVCGLIWISDSVYLFRDIEIIAWATLVFGVLLYMSDRFFLTVRNIETITTFHAIIFGLAQVYSRQLKELPISMINASTGIFGFIILIIISVFIEGNVQKNIEQINFESWMLISYQAVIVSLCAHLLMFYLYKFYTVGKIFPFYSLFPIFGIILTYLVFGEVPTILFILGGIIVITSVFFLHKIK